MTVRFTKRTRSSRRKNELKHTRVLIVPYPSMRFEFLPNTYRACPIRIQPSAPAVLAKRANATIAAITTRSLIQPRATGKRTGSSLPNVNASSLIGGWLKTRRTG
jgi:hypothetical protein